MSSIFALSPCFTSVVSLSLTLSFVSYESAKELLDKHREVYFWLQFAFCFFLSAVPGS
jgi:hypothetical protein